MKWKMFLVVLSVMFVVSSAQAQKDDLPYGVMRPDAKTIKKWNDNFLRQPLAEISRTREIKQGNFSLLDKLNFDSALRDQGKTGTCWIWAGTGCLSIALNVQEPTYKPENGLSVQLLASNAGIVGADLDSGGDMPQVIDFYSRVGYSIAWTNNNAEWQDGDGKQNCPSSWIFTNPRYPISTISSSAVSTIDVEQATAITNIKAALNQNQPVFLAFYMPTADDWKDFSSYWSNDPETAIINLDKYPVAPWNNGAGHAVVCVGYDDTAPELENQYWIILNSWGNAKGKRMDGCFRLSMNLNYSKQLTQESSTFYAYQWSVVNVEFSDVMNKRFDSVSFNFNNGRPNADTCAISKYTFSGSSPTSITSAVLRLNKFPITCNSSTGTWTPKGNVFKFKSNSDSKSKVEITVDGEKKFWSAKVTKSDINRIVNYYDALDFNLSTSPDESVPTVLGNSCTLMLMISTLKPQGRQRRTKKTISYCVIRTSRSDFTDMSANALRYRNWYRFRPHKFITCPAMEDWMFNCFF